MSDVFHVRARCRVGLLRKVKQVCGCWLLMTKKLIDHAAYFCFAILLNIFKNTETFLRPLPLEDLFLSYVQLNQIITEASDSTYMGDHVLNFKSRKVTDDTVHSLLL